GGERWMGGHEEQRQPLVDVLTREGRLGACDCAGALIEEEVCLAAGGLLPPQGVHRPSMSDRAHPSGRVGRGAVDRPRGGGLGEGVGQCVLDEVRSSEAVDQLSEQPAPVLPPDPVEDVVAHGQYGSTTGDSWMSYGGSTVSSSTSTSRSGTSMRK